MKKLHKAAITLPAEPRPIIFSFADDVFILIHAEFVPSWPSNVKTIPYWLHTGRKGDLKTFLAVLKVIQWLVSATDSQNVANSTIL
jgi:hypothetical protein